MNKWVPLWLLLCWPLGCDQFFSEPAVQYTVKRGDTLSKIAQAHDVTVDDLRSWNGISGDLIEVGQMIEIRSDPTNLSEEPKKKRHKRVRKQSAPTPSNALKMPKKKKCLAGPTLESLSDDVPDIQSSMGLSYEQIQAPMSAFLPNLGRCFESDWPTARVEFEITAACNGRVSKVTLLNGDGVDASALECMRTTLAFVGLPAHDMPDGMTFQYPVTLGR